MDTQLSAIFFFPAKVQVHDHGILPSLIVAELVQMLFIKAAFFIQCIMKFVTRYSRIASAVQVAYKCIHQIKKTIFMNIFMFAVEPVNFVTSEALVLHYDQIVTGTRRAQLPVVKQVQQIGNQV